MNIHNLDKLAINIFIKVICIILKKIEMKKF